MKLFFIVDDKENSMFYYYIHEKNERKLIQLAPNLMINGEHLGKIYSDSTISSFLDEFSKNLAVTIDYYCCIPLNYLAEMVLNKNKVFLMQPNKAFEMCNISFNEKHIAEVDSKTLLKCISYQEENENAAVVFDRQEYILRIYKQKIIKDISFKQVIGMYQDLKQNVSTNILPKNILSFFGLLNKTNKKINRLMLPSNHDSSKNEEETKVILTKFIKGEEQK